MFVMSCHTLGLNFISCPSPHFRLRISHLLNAHQIQQAQVLRPIFNFFLGQFYFASIKYVRLLANLEMMD